MQLSDVSKAINWHWVGRPSISRNRTTQGYSRKQVHCTWVEYN